MTTDEQREIALHLYRLAWRFPEHAPEPIDAQHSDEYGVSGYIPYYVAAGGAFIEVIVFDPNYALIVVQNYNERRLVIEGPPSYVETVLRLIPDETRPHMERTQQTPSDGQTKIAKEEL